MIDLPPGRGTIGLRFIIKTNIFTMIEAVKPLSGKNLLVQFVGGQQKVYDCGPLLKQEPFSALENDSLLR